MCENPSVAERWDADRFADVILPDGETREVRVVEGHLLRFSTRSRSRFRIIGSRGKRRSEGGAERLKKTGERQAPPQVFNGYSYRRQSLERAIHRLSEAR